MSIQRMWDPVAYALGFIDCDNISARCMLTIFSLFATKTEASLLRMLKGSPDMYLSGPIRKYIIDKGGRYYLWNVRTLDEWNSHSLFAFCFSYIHFLLSSARTGSILGGGVERYCMIKQLMETHMSQDLLCLR
jgi:hypothetical protein